LVKLTKEEIFTLFEALSMSYGFYVDSGRQDEAERMKHLMDLFFFVKSADVELTPGDGDDGGNVRKINEPGTFSHFPGAFSRRADFTLSTLDISLTTQTQFRAREPGVCKPHMPGERAFL